MDTSVTKMCLYKNLVEQPLQALDTLTNVAKCHRFRNPATSSNTSSGKESVGIDDSVSSVIFVRKVEDREYSIRDRIYTAASPKGTCCKTIQTSRGKTLLSIAKALSEFHIV